MLTARPGNSRRTFESLQDLHANLGEHGIDARLVPLVLQYNKQNLPPELILDVPAMDEALNFRGVPAFAADALRGPGVFETLRGISELVLRRLSGAGAGALPHAAPASSPAAGGGAPPTRAPAPTARASSGRR